MTTPTPEDIEPEVKLHETMDAVIWADEFNRVLVSKGQQPYDPGWLIGWFANAIMCGWDHAGRKIGKERSLAIEGKEGEIKQFKDLSNSYWDQLCAKDEALESEKKKVEDLEGRKKTALELLGEERKKVETVMVEAEALVQIVASKRKHDSECLYHLDKTYPCGHCQALDRWHSFKRKMDL